MDVTGALEANNADSGGCSSWCEKRRAYMYFLSMNINLITVRPQLEGSSTRLFYMYVNTYNYVYKPLPIKYFIHPKSKIPMLCKGC